MDANLDLLIPRGTDYPSRGRQQSWQGVASEESKRFFDWGMNHTVQLFNGSPPPHIMRLLAPELRVGPWDHLSITGDGLDMYWHEQRGHEVDWHGSRFEGLLTTLLRDAPRWALVFDYSDSIDAVISTDLDGLIAHLRDNLRADHRPRGFLAYR